MSKTNDPSGTALRVQQHPRLARIIRKVAVWSVIARYRRASLIHLRYRHLPNYKLFRYEDLLADPEPTLRDVCAFIEAPYGPALLHPETGIHQHQPSSLTGKQQKALDAKAAVRWRSTITRTDNFLISILTGPSMKRFAYNPEKHPIFNVDQRSLRTSGEAITVV